ncbi:MAG: PRC-barrel domain-containing protein, partial [Ginsengibacter sp.]
MSKEIVNHEVLQELGSSGFEMAKGDPDIRGWDAINTLNQKIGKVKELLFDTKARKVRYLILNLDGRAMNLLSRDILIPVGVAELEQNDKVVLLPHLNAGHYASLPDYKKGTVTFQTERAIRDVFVPQAAVPNEKLADHNLRDDREREAFYNNQYFDENRMYKGSLGETLRNDTNSNRPDKKDDDVLPVATPEYLRRDDDIRRSNDVN